MNQDNGNNPESQPAQTDVTSHENPKNPFRDDAPVVEPNAADDAAMEQQRKEALTERD